MGDCCGQGRAPETRRSVWADVSARPLPGRTPLGGQTASAGCGASRFRRASAKPVVAAGSGVVRDDGGELFGDVIVGALCELVAPGVVRPVVDGSAAPVELTAGRAETCDHSDRTSAASSGVGLPLGRIVAESCSELPGNKGEEVGHERSSAPDRDQRGLRLPLETILSRGIRPSRETGPHAKALQLRDLYRSLAAADECSSGDPAASPNALRARLRPTRDGRGHIAHGHGNSPFSRTRTRTRAGLPGGAPSGGSPQMRGAS